MLNIGIRAAHAAGDHIVRSMDRLEGVKISKKGRNDYVSDVDKQAEVIIIDTLRNSYPDHSFLAEESGEHGNSEFQWIIDPLDGTTNYIHGFPQFAVSIALKHKGVLDQAIVYDPLRQELFTASKGGGAYLNKKRMRVSRQNTFVDALIGTGFPYRKGDDIDHYMAALHKIMRSCAGIRRPGAASLDLAYVACGRLDGFWEYGLSEWDVAAGILLIREAGGIESGAYVDGVFTGQKQIIAGTEKIHSELIKLINNN